MQGMWHITLFIYFPKEESRACVCVSRLLGRRPCALCSAYVVRMTATFWFVDVYAFITSYSWRMPVLWRGFYVLLATRKCGADWVFHIDDKYKNDYNHMSTRSSRFVYNAAPAFKLEIERERHVGASLHCLLCEQKKKCHLCARNDWMARSILVENSHAACNTHRWCNACS